MGLISDGRTKLKLGRAVTAVHAAGHSGNPALLVTAFREVLKLATEVEQELAAKVSLSAVWAGAHEKTLLAARSMIEAANAFLFSCDIQGDRLKGWHPEIADASMATVASAYQYAVSAD